MENNKGSISHKTSFGFTKNFRFLMLYFLTSLILRHGKQQLFSTNIIAAPNTAQTQHNIQFLKETKWKFAYILPNELTFYTNIACKLIHFSISAYSMSKISHSSLCRPRPNVNTGTIIMPKKYSKCVSWGTEKPHLIYTPFLKVGLLK